MDKKEVTEEEGINFAKEKNAIFIKTSAFSGDGINLIFEKIGEAILDPIQKFQIKKQKRNDKLDKNNNNNNSNNNNSNKKEYKNNSNNIKENKIPKNRNIKLQKPIDKKNNCC